MTRYTPLWLQAGSYAASIDRWLPGALWPNPATSGCAVTAAAGMTVNVDQGQVAVPTGNGTGTLLCPSDAPEQVILAAAPASGTNRYDLVICQARGQDVDGGGNDDFIFTTVTGVAAATPAVPPVPANAVALAQVYIPGGSAAITPGNITDVRPFGLSLGGASAKPPPLDASAPMSFYRDQTDEIWIAKGGVLAGAWVRATHALKAKWYRFSPITASTANNFNTIPFDQPVYDRFSLGTTLNGGTFKIPLTGFYRTEATVHSGGAVTGRWIVSIWRNGLESSGQRGDDHNSPSSAATGGQAGMENRLTVNDTVGAAVYPSVAAALLTGPGVCSVSLNFLGPDWDEVRYGIWPAYT